MQQRLVFAHDRLIDPRRSNDRITDIALEVGFKEIRTFNRTFRRHHDRTRSERREQAIKRTS